MYDAYILHIYLDISILGLILILNVIFLFLRISFIYIAAQWAEITFKLYILMILAHRKKIPLKQEADSDLVTHHLLCGTGRRDNFSPLINSHENVNSNNHYSHDSDSCVSACLSDFRSSPMKFLRVGMKPVVCVHPIEIPCARATVPVRRHLGGS